MSEDESETSKLLADLAAMRTEMSELRAKVAELEDTRTAAATSAEASTERTDVSSRRRLLALAGGAAAAAVAGATIAGAQPAAAANGSPVILANNTTADAGQVISTFLNYSLPTANSSFRHLLVVGDSADAFSPGAAARTAAVSGYASRTVAIGVSGHSVSGPGVVAESDQSWSLQVGGTGRVFIGQAAAAGPPTSGSFSKGELVRDGNADVWVCVAGGAGAAAQWRKLAFEGSSPALRIISPTRVFDSRLVAPGSKLASGTSRTISVANGIDVNSGAVAVPDVVPAGATAVQFTLTVDGATNNGFLALTPGGSPTYTASTVNWTTATPTIASGGLCKLDGARQLTAFAGGPGASAHFIVDITGFYV